MQSQAWLDALRGPPAVREQALADLHALLLRGARFHLSRLSPELSHISYTDADDLAIEAADDALVTILEQLDSFNGRSRFSTWAAKYAIVAAGVKARRRAGTRAKQPSPSQLRP